MRRVLGALGAVGLALGVLVGGDPVGAQVAPTTTTVDPATAAARAAAAWSPPEPRIRTNPPPGRAQVAGLATWLWVEPPGPLTVRTPEGLTLEARAATTRFELGDGATLTCTGTGTPYDPARPEASQSSECTHAWEATSAGKTLQARATVTWALFFEGRPVATRTASGDLDLAVAEGQALDRRPDPMSGAEAAANAATDRADANAGGGRPLADLARLVPPKDDRNWFERALGATGDFLGKAPGRLWGGVRDLGIGIYHGVVDPLALIWEFSTLRALLDWDGFSQSVSGISDAIRADPWGFAKEMFKGFVAWDDWAAGRPLKAIGTMVPGAVLAVFTGGGSLAARAASGAGKGVPAATRAARGLDEVADASRGAKGAQGAAATRAVDHLADTAKVSDRLQSHVDDAVRQFDEGEIRLSPAQQRAAAANPNLAETYRGQVIDKAVKDAVRDDPALEGLYTTRSGELGPDFSDPATGRWWDVTTPEQWPAHETRYNDPFGQGTQLPTRPPRP